MTDLQKQQLEAPLPAWAIKPHPTKTYLTVIHPMAVIDRLNDVFGTGVWHISYDEMPMSGKFAIVKGRFSIPNLDIYLEQFGGNDNVDVGDAYKGAATDALTKIASYLGIGANIYRGKGNEGLDTQKSVKTAQEVPTIRR